MHEKCNVSFGSVACTRLPKNFGEHVGQPHDAVSCKVLCLCMRLYSYVDMQLIPCNLLRIILLDHSGLNNLKSENDGLQCMCACIFDCEV
jgi:hypothetical protein